MEFELSLDFTRHKKAKHAKYKDFSLDLPFKFRSLWSFWFPFEYFFGIQMHAYKRKYGKFYFTFYLPFFQVSIWKN